MLSIVPWLLVPVALYLLIAVSSSWPEPGATGEAARHVFQEDLFSLNLISGAEWSLTLGDVMIILTLVLLFFELIKATRTGGASIVDHALSTILFIFCIIIFLTVRQAATSVFFIITVVTLIDVIAGFSITIRAARRDLAFGGHN